MSEGKGDLSKVSYCGLYCGLCSTCNRVPKRAKELANCMRKDGWEHWGGHVPGFAEFWPFLNGLVENEEKCSCRGGCGAPFCTIRKCAKAKGYELCTECGEYPCSRIDGLAKGYVTLIADNHRRESIGLAAWLEEQEERRKTGFCYTDIRCHPYDVPDK